jgi:hypothetical protein
VCTSVSCVHAISRSTDMAPDIYNTVAPTRPAQTRSRAVARPPLGKAVAPHATGGGHGVMPRARRPLAVGVLIGAARTTGDLPPRIPSRGVFGSRLKPRWVATPARVSHAPGPRPRPAPTPAHPTRRCLWSYFGAVGPRRATRVATIARSQRTKYLTRGRDLVPGRTREPVSGVFPQRPVPHVHLYVWEI